MEWFQKKEDRIRTFSTDTYASIFVAKEEEWDTSYGMVWALGSFIFKMGDSIACFNTDGTILIERRLFQNYF